MFTRLVILLQCDSQILVTANLFLSKRKCLENRECSNVWILGASVFVLSSPQKKRSVSICSNGNGIPNRMEIGKTFAGK